MQWINEGDNNTEFFHRIINSRKRCNTINSIFINIIELADQRDLNNAFTNYYKDIFGNKNKRRIKASWDELYPIASKVNLDDIDGSFTEEEILKAINDMPSDKVPGPDGFSVLFYKRFWNILKFN